MAMDENWVVYILQSEYDSTYYVGMTTDLSSRIKPHNSGRVRYTKGRMPWKLVYTEAVGSRLEARCLEKYYKSSAGKRKLKLAGKL